MKRIEQGGDVNKENEVETEFNSERVDKAMLARHKNAVELVRILHMALDAVGKIEMAEYTSTNSQEYKALVESLGKEYEKLDVRFKNEQRRAQFANAIKEYIDQVMLAFEQEIELNRLVVDRGIEGSNEEALGKLIFNLLTNKKNQGAVSAERKEGYFLVFLEDHEDYELVGKKGSGGCYSEAYYLRDIGYAKVICIRTKYSGTERPLISWCKDGVVAHERQHFFNNVAFNYFKNTELPQGINRKNEFYGISGQEESLRNIKDELLAQLRDQSAESATNFLDNKLYENLLTPFTDGDKKSIKKLMEQIKNELINGLFGLFESRREILVYQLIDVPLVKIPEVLKRMRKFYDKVRPHYTKTFSNLVPPDLSKEEKESAKDDERLKKLEDLYLDIVGLDYSVIYTELKNFNIETLENTVDIEEMKKTEKELRDLRKEYDNLYKEIFK